jgi:hypothetical protein
MAFSNVAKPYYTREDFADILRECGYKATFFEEPGLFPQILSGVVGHNFEVTLRGDNIEDNHNNRIKEVFFELYPANETTYELVNEWNRNYNILNSGNIVVAVCRMSASGKIGHLGASAVIPIAYTAPAYIARQIARWDREISQLLAKCQSN